MSGAHVAIVGGGIVGLAHAWSAAERGHRVTLFERNRTAIGASIRNFGMIWPIGQPHGERFETALLSRERWLHFATSSGLWLNECGSIHLAHRDDEWAVLEEFHEIAKQNGIATKLLTPAEVIRRTPAANRTELRGGLFSPYELGVNPRVAIPTLTRWLVEQQAITLRSPETVVSVERDQHPDTRLTLRTNHNVELQCDRVVVCGGDDLRTLFPGTFAAAPLRLCKLQMLKTVPQPKAWTIGTHLASGLTLRHYENFSVCPSLPALKQRIATETPELDHFGIHVMAAQNDAGEIILGDSHEYDDAIAPFDQSHVDELILRELHHVIELPDWTIAERWHGIYTKSTEAPVFEAEPLPGAYTVTATSGAGMTLAFGLAERAWERWPQLS